MTEPELSYRIRAAVEDDAAGLRLISGATLSHPEGKGRREAYKAAIQRGELFVFERSDSRTHEWRISAFVDFHVRVDDVVTIHDVGTEGEGPHSGMVKQLINELFQTFGPTEAHLKVRADAAVWNDIIRSIVGFELEGSEYRRPHWINVWKWSREAAALANRGQRGQRFRR